MAEVHGLLARVALVLALVTAAWTVVLVAGRRPIRPALLGGFAWIVVLIAATGLLGVVLGLTAGWPADPLHLVYGVLAAVTLPGAWALSRTRPDPRRTVLVLAVAAIVQVILVVRLLQTGG
ncbi:MAG: hypothetical protein AB1736_10905 [Chloroflexota bacterium]